MTEDLSDGRIIFCRICIGPRFVGVDFFFKLCDSVVEPHGLGIHSGMYI